MAGYNNFPGPDSKIQVCVVASDDGENKPDDNSCNQKYFSPLDHGTEVDLDHLAFNPLSMSPTGFGQQAFPGIMDPGTPVLVLKQLGMNGGIILGQTNSKREKGGSSSKLGGSKTIEKLTTSKLNVNVAPDIKETEDEDGVKIRKIIEKGGQHSLDLLDGLPMHGALFNMAGFRLPDIKKVPTAKQTNDGMMNGQMMQQMMGQIMSLGQMFQGLAGRGGAGGGGGGYGAGFSGFSSGESFVPNGANTGAGGAMWDGGLGNNSISAFNAPENTRMYQIIEGQTAEMKAAINSLSNLIQGLEVNGGVSYFTGDVVHEETYLQNAQDLLSQATNVDELMSVLHRLQWDTSLFGQEKLDNVVNEIETAWGVALQEIDVNGNIIISYGSDDANTEMAFLESMTSNTGAPALGYFEGTDSASINGTGVTTNPLSSPTIPAPSGSGGGGTGGGGGGGAGQIAGQIQGILGQVQGLAQGMSQNMFGESAGTMKDLWKRMTRDQEQDAKKMHEKLNQADDTQKMSKIVEKNTKGGNPIDMEGGEFDGGMLNGLGGMIGSGNFGVGFM
jgi:hypothetical protein